MRQQWTVVRDALQGAKRFLDETTGLLSEAVDFTGARRWLDELLLIFAEQSDIIEVSDRAASNGIATQHELRIKLRKEQMEPIAAIARLTLRHQPGFSALKMPNPAARGWKFTVSARAMADTAAIHQDKFVKRGLPPTFLEDLECAIATLEESVSDREYNLVRRMLASRELEQTARYGRLVLRVLDGLVRQAAGCNESLLRGWQAARLIRRTAIGEMRASAA